MTKLASLVAFAALVLVTSACGGSSSDSPGNNTTAASCTITDHGQQACAEWSNTFSGSVQQACTANQGTYSSSGCSSAGRVGRCALNYSGFVETISYYSGTAASLQQGCVALNGQSGLTTTWTPN